MPGPRVTRPKYFEELKPYNKVSATVLCKPYVFTALHEQSEASDMKITCHCETDNIRSLNLHLDPTSIVKMGEGKYKAEFAIHSLVMSARSSLFHTNAAKVMKAASDIDLSAWPIQVVSCFVQFLYGFYDHLEGQYDILPILDQWQISKDVVYALCPIIAYGHSSIREAISTIVAMKDHPYTLTYLGKQALIWLVNWTVISSGVALTTDNASLCKLPFSLFYDYVRSPYIFTIHVEFLTKLINFYKQFNEVTDEQEKMLDVLCKTRAKETIRGKKGLLVMRTIDVFGSKKNCNSHRWVQDFFESEQEMRDAYKEYRIVKHLCFNDDEEYFKAFKWDTPANSSIATYYFKFSTGGCRFWEGGCMPAQINEYTLSSPSDYAIEGKVKTVRPIMPIKLGTGDNGSDTDNESDSESDDEDN